MCCILVCAADFAAPAAGVGAAGSVVYAAVPIGLDEAIGLGILGGGRGDAEDGSGADDGEASAAVRAEPLMEAEPDAFAEALAEEYRPGDGYFGLGDKTRFYIACEGEPDKDLADTVRLMASEFAAYGIPSDAPLPVVYGEPEFAQPGDIVITLADEEDFHPGIVTADTKQAYRIDIYDTAMVEACTTDGIWYALTELMEIALEHRGGDGSVLLERFHLKDGPDLKERALMLDCGRKYYSKEWIENLIRRASLQRYNALILHFAEAEGIRLDSEKFPWLTDSIDSLTTDEMREIAEVARRYHVDIIPSFDTPGHNTFMVKRYAEYVKSDPDFSFELDGKTYDSSIKGFGSIANHYSHGGETEASSSIGIDLTKEHAVAFTEAVIDDYADFFRSLGCTKMDIGSDELLGWYSFELGGKQFNYDNRWGALEHWTKYARNTLGIKKGSASDVLITYINDVADRLEAKGYTCRVFNDEIDINSNQHVKLKESVEITYWFDPDNTAGHFAEEGHMVHNFMESWCFYVLRKDNGRDIMKGKYKTVNAANIFENWDPKNFARKSSGDMRVPDDKLAGGYFAIWCDHPDYKDAETVWEETEMKTWANASKMWNAEVSSDKSGIRNALRYEDMKAFALGMEGYPGYTGDPEVSPNLVAVPEPADGVTGWQRWVKKMKDFF